MGEIGIFLVLNPGFRAARYPESQSSFPFHHTGLSSELSTSNVLIFKGFVTVLLCNPQLLFCSKLFSLTDLLIILKSLLFYGRKERGANPINDHTILLRKQRSCLECEMMGSFLP